MTVGTGSDPRRKLLIAAGSVAAFLGFVALTAWTSSGEMDEQETRDMGNFCYVLSMSSDYESMIRDAFLAGGQGSFGAGGAIDSGFSSFIENTLLEYAPERYREEASHVVGGLQQGLRGELSAEEADQYVADFQALENRASGDCEQFEGEAPDFGGGGGSPFGFDDED
jgi:hypothetical protein